MKFEDISFYVTIGIAIINITGTLRTLSQHGEKNQRFAGR